MTVEFLDADDYPGDHEARPGEAPEDRRVRLGRLADVVLSLAGAALLVVGTFQAVYSVSNSDADFDYRVTGWGRIDTGDNDFIGGNAPRLGILFCAIAALIVLALAARHRRARLGTALGFGALGAALAALGSVVLDVLTTRDNLDLQTGTTDDGNGTITRVTQHFTIGGVVWLSAAGIVCTALGLVAPAVVRFGDRRTRLRDAPVEVSENDEQLG